MREELVECLEDHAVLARLQGEVEAGVRLAATAQAYRSRLDLVRSPQGERKWEARLDALRSHLPAQAFAEVWNAGSNAELESAIRAAHTLCSADRELSVDCQRANSQLLRRRLRPIAASATPASASDAGSAPATT